MPYHHSTLVLVLVAAIAGVWAVVLLWPGPAPFGLLGLIVMVAAVGAPGSMVSFDLAPTFHPSERYGRVNEMIYVGGFVAALLTIGLIGLVLDQLAPTDRPRTRCPTSASPWRCSSRSGQLVHCSCSATGSRSGHPSPSTPGRWRRCAGRDPASRVVLAIGPTRRG